MILDPFVNFEYKFENLSSDFRFEVFLVSEIQYQVVQVPVEEVGVTGNDGPQFLLSVLEAVGVVEGLLLQSLQKNPQNLLLLDLLSLKTQLESSDNLVFLLYEWKLEGKEIQRNLPLLDIQRRVDFEVLQVVFKDLKQFGVLVLVHKIQEVNQIVLLQIMQEDDEFLLELALNQQTEGFESVSLVELCFIDQLLLPVAFLAEYPPQEALKLPKEQLVELLLESLELPHDFFLVVSYTQSIVFEVTQSPHFQFQRVFYNCLLVLDLFEAVEFLAVEVLVVDFDAVV